MDKCNRGNSRVNRRIALVWIDGWDMGYAEGVTLPWRDWYHQIEQSICLCNVMHNID